MKDLYCSYYTDSEEITSYMVKKLGITKDDLILEPSAGEGIFIDEILKQNLKVKIDALDINEEAINVLKRKYDENEDVSVRLTDTLFDEELDTHMSMTLWLKNSDTLLDNQLDFFSAMGGYYNKVIGNPPYGAWQDYDKRGLLKKKYPGQYVKETYTLFLLRSLSVLKMNGRLSFIVPDTFLFLNMHEKLRRIILTHSKIEEILIFPSKFFPGVSFGYSNLSIITFEKCSKEEALNNKIKIIKNFNSSNEFAGVLKGEYLENQKIFELKQSEILSTEKSRFILAENETALKIDSAKTRLGDIANIVTGFYSGDNKKYICAKNGSIKGAKDYSQVNDAHIYDCTSLKGIESVREGYVPYVKGSSPTRYMRKEDEWFVRWDEDTVKFYNEDKKARFQNSQYYFKKGIAIPMVKSREIRATLMDKRVFDQSIVGIFPKVEDKIFYLLALMNSEVVNKLIHVINPTANNSSNYIKQIPYIEPDSDNYCKIQNNVKLILSLDIEKDSNRIMMLHGENNLIIEKTYQ